MNTQSRTIASITNIIYGILSQILVLLLGFAGRTIFIHYLSVEYLGINGLFSNILTILSLADLGLGTAVIYSLYKPLAQKDYDKVAALTNFYKKVYQKIALAVLVFGLILLPFLDTIVNLQNKIDNLYLYYILFVINSSISYLYVYKTSIITADQKSYLLKKYYVYSNILKFILQIFVLINFQSFTLYLIANIFGTFINNYWGAKKAERLYELNDKVLKIDNIEKKSIFENVKSMFIYRISGIALNNITNICMSVFVGTVWVGYYSNYSMIVNGINSFLLIVISALQTSVGNFVNTEKIEKQFTLYEVLNFAINCLLGIVVVMLYTYTDKFIELWIGKEYVLSQTTLILIILNFWLPNVLAVNWIFRETTNMFMRVKYVILVTATFNLFFMVILGPKFFMEGVLIAPILARLCTNFWYEPYLLYKVYFKEKFIKYIKKVSLYVIYFTLLAVLNNYFYNYIKIINFLDLLLCSLVNLVLLVLIIFISFYSSQEFNYLRSNLFNILLHKK